MEPIQCGDPSRVDLGCSSGGLSGEDHLALKVQPPATSCLSPESNCSEIETALSDEDCFQNEYDGDTAVIHNLPSDRKQIICRCSERNQGRNVLIGIICLLLISISSVLLAKIPKNNENEKVNPKIEAEFETEATSRMKQLRKILWGVSNAQAMIDSAMPQYAALAWLAEKDPAMLDLDDTPTSVLKNRYIMALLYFSTEGDGWRRANGFLSPVPICEWNDGGTGGAVDGVACENNEVVEITLEINSLGGTIPTEIGHFNLRLLGLGGNSIEGSIPTEIGKMTELHSLSLNGNFLTGSIPFQLKNLVNLKHLFLHKNLLEGSIPPAFEALESLEMIFMEGNNFSGNLDNAFCEGREDPLQYFYASCAEEQLTCSCCTHCCQLDGRECAHVLRTWIV